jgi:hypothetical protein
VAVPTVVPPLVHVLGALACGPNTLNVIEPAAPLVAPPSVELTAPAGIAVPDVPAAGPDTVVVVVALPTEVEAMLGPQALLDAPLLESPL